MCFLGFLIWMSPSFSFAATTHCTFINLASVSTRAKMPSERRERTCQGPSGGAPSHPCMCLISSVWNSVGDFGRVGGKLMDQHAWGKNDGRARRDRGLWMLHCWLASLTVRETLHGCWWKIVPSITWLHSREDATKPPQVHHGGGLPQTQYEDTGFNLRSEEPLMT